MRAPAEPERRRIGRGRFASDAVGGRRKRGRREPEIDGMPVEEFIRRNGGPAALHGEELWWLIEEENDPHTPDDPTDADLPF